MKKIVITCFILGLVGLSFKSAPVEVLVNNVINNGAFQKGEFLKYRVHYGMIDAAEATIEIKKKDKIINGKKALHVVGIGRSNSFFDWFFKVRDRYETYISEETLMPLLFIRRVDEGGYKITQNMTFNHEAGEVNSDGKIFKVPENVQDMFSALFYARCIDFTNAKPGNIYVIPSFVDNEYFPIKIKFVGREILRSDVGKVRCLKFRPVVQQGRIFKEEEDLNVWITDDKNHIPVRAQADILIGSLRVDLTEYNGLSSALDIKK